MQSQYLGGHKEKRPLSSRSSLYHVLENTTMLCLRAVVPHLSLVSVHTKTQQMALCSVPDNRNLFWVILYIRTLLHSPHVLYRVSDFQYHSTTATATHIERFTRHSKFKDNIHQATWQTNLAHEVLLAVKQLILDSRNLRTLFFHDTSHRTIGTKLH